MANEFKSEFEKLVGQFIKFNLIKTIVSAISILIIIDCFSQVSSPEIKSQINLIKQLSDSTGVHLTANDFIVDEILTASQYDGSGRATGPLRDTVLQKQMLNKLSGEVTKIFQIKLSIITDATLDLRFWVFIFPIAFIFVEIYNYILKVKIKVVGLTQAQFLSEKNQSLNKLEQLMLVKSPYSQFPYAFLKFFFTVFDYIIFGVFLYYLVTFLSIDESGALFFCGLPYLLLVYYSVWYAHVYSNQLSTVLELDSPIFVVRRRLTYLLKLIFKKLASVKLKFTVPVSSALIFLTLIMVMAVPSCGGRSYKGYKFITEPISSNWNVGEDYAPFDRILQYCYLIAICLSIVFCILFYFKLRSPLKSFLLLISTTLTVFVLFTLYFSLFLFATVTSSWKLTAAICLTISGSMFVASYFILKKSIGLYEPYFKKIVISIFPFWILAFLFSMLMYPGWFVFYTGLTVFPIILVGLIQKHP